ncbi:MAG: hypothetical protein ACKVS8_14480 [Phycisphaerales bacterium]
MDENADNSAPEKWRVLDKVVQNLLDTMTPDGTGWHLSPHQELAFLALDRAIEHCFTDAKSHARPSRLARTVIQQLGREGQSATPFRAEFQKCLAAAARADAESHAEHVLILPLELPLTEAPKEPVVVRLLSEDMSLISMAAALDALGGEKDLAARSLSLYFGAHPMPGGAIRIATMAANSDHAWASVAQAVDLFRGLVEYTLLQGVMSIDFGSSKPWGVCPHPRAGIVVSGGKAVVARFDLPPSVELRLPFRTLTATDLLARLDGIGSLLRDRPPRGTVRELLARVVVLYGRAMSAHEVSDRFVILWQLLEAVTLSHADRGSGEEVVKRASRLLDLTFGYDYVQARLVLDNFKDIRNAVVHDGEVGLVSEEHARLMRFWCERVLSWMFGAAAELDKATELTVWWRLLLAPDADLDGMLRLIPIVQRLRATTRRDTSPPLQSVRPKASNETAGGNAPGLRVV